MIKNAYIAMIACLILALTGCASNLGVHDPSVPQNQLCTLKIESTLYVHKFDGAAVNWGGGLYISDTIIQISAGKHYFVMDYLYGNASSTHTAKNLSYNYTFEAGKTYFIYSVESNGRVSVHVRTE